MASDENVFRRGILDVVGEVLRDLQASMTETALFRLDWLLDVVNRYADSLGTIIDLNQIHRFSSGKLATVFVLMAALLQLELPRWSLAVNRADHVTILQENRFNF